MLEAIGTGLTQFITYAGQVVTAVTGAEGALAPLLPVIGLGIGASVILFGVKLIRSLVWGM